MTRRSSALILGCVALGALAGCSGNTADAAADGPATSTPSGAHAPASAGKRAEASPKSSASADTKGSGESTKDDGQSSDPGGQASAKSKKTTTKANKKRASDAKNTKASKHPDSTGESTMTATSVLNRLPSPAGKCPAVGNGRDVRSGTMAAGPFNTAKAQFAASKPTSPESTKVRLYWIPKSGKVSPHGLVLKITKVGAAGTANTVRDAVVADAGGVSFYDSQVPIASAGTWQIRATSGSDTGCFRVTFTK